MKRILLMYFALLTIFGLVSCGDLLETSNNGKLDGNWQLVTIDTLETGGQLDMVEDRKFYAVQGTIFQAYDVDESIQYIFRFTYVDNHLSLSDARINERTQGDPTVTDLALLQPFGINKVEESFTVELSGSRMILTSNQLRLTFRKF